MSSAQLRCTVPFCQMKFFSMKNTIKHVKQHMKNNSGTKVLCPYEGCQKKYCRVSSFSAHLSRCHDALKRTARAIVCKL